MKFINIFLLEVLFIFFIASFNNGCSSDSLKTNKIAEQSSEDWEISTPDSAGLIKDSIINMEKFVEKSLPNILSILIVKNEKLVYENYFKNYDKDDLFECASITKSITSALVGISLKKGYIKSLDEKIINYFPEFIHLSKDNRINDVTIKHLLTMTSGWQWNESEDITKWYSSDNPNKFTFELPFSDNPGEVFNYNTAGTHLLISIIAEASGMNSLEFAKKELLEPLGITDFEWRQDQQGNLHGGFRSSFRARDLAKSGLLFLSNGVWQGNELIQIEFIDLATTPYTNGGLPENEKYGFLWWIDNVSGFKSFFAAGFGGQYVYVIPELDLIVIITSTLDRSHIENRSVIENFIIPAVKK